MEKTNLSIPFTETEEQRQQMAECIAEHKGQLGAIMPTLQKTQQIYGYLPLEVLKRIGREMDIPLERLYSVGTFYSQFTFAPKGKYDISVCMGTACYVKGAGDILDEFSTQLGIQAEETTPDGKFSLTACRCIGACGLAPVITINEEVYGRLDRKSASKVLAEYMAKD